MDFNQKVLDEYNELKLECLDSPSFGKVLAAVEQSIIERFKISSDDALEAHYEYKAFKRILDRLNSIKLSGELETAKLTDYNNGGTGESLY